MTTTNSDFASDALNLDECRRVIAQLSLDAPSKYIEAAIRLYDPSLTECNQTKAFKIGLNKERVSDTLEYLWIIKTWKDYKLEECINDLICRIQNLLPTKCNFCEGTYAVHVSDMPLLPCAICGQDPHKACLADALNLQEDDLTSESIKMIMNPLKLPGFYYLCPECVTITIPCEQAGMTKAAAKQFLKSSSKSSAINDQSTAKITTTIAVDDPEEACEQNSGSSSCSPLASKKGTPVSSQSSNSDFSAPSTSSNIDQTNTDQISSIKKVTISGLDATEKNEKHASTCRLFLKGTCPHGMRGRTNGTCKFYHPNTCNRLLKHGTRSKQGCNKGRHCEHFHPKMCTTSITKGECFDNECKFFHVAGTKQINPKLNRMLTHPKSQSTAMVLTIHHLTQHLF